MMIALIGLILVLLLAVAAVVAARRARKPGGAIPAYRQRNFLSKAERSFFNVLQQAIGRDGLVFAKVRLADLLTPASVSGGEGWQAALNRIKTRHVDFVLCTPGDLQARLAIELDDPAQRQARRKERDEFIESVLRSAGLPLLRVPAHRDYVIQQLRAQLSQYLDLPPERPSTLEMVVVVKQPAAPAKPPPPAEKPPPPSPEKPAIAQDEPPAPVPAPAAPPGPAADSGVPACPKCGGTMVRREGKSGPLAGRLFWGCSNFPQCKGLLPFAQNLVPEVPEPPGFLT
jgi:hypothetical protein